MLAYAADNPRPAGRAGSPRSLALIIVGHAALLAAVMTARIEFEPGGPSRPIDVIKVPTPPPPPPPPPAGSDTKPTPEPVQGPVIEPVRPIIPMKPIGQTELATGPTHPLPPLGGGGGTIVPDPPRHVPVKLGPRFATAGSALRPPYPLDKLRAEEEAKLTLKLSIDPRGRVVGVEPVGTVDPSFLEAARRHILRAWRYKPATEDGVAVPSSTVIALTFRLEDA